MATESDSCLPMQAVDVVLDHDDDDMNPDANGAVVINMGGHHPEDGMGEAGIHVLKCLLQNLPNVTICHSCIWHVWMYLLMACVTVARICD